MNEGSVLGPVTTAPLLLVYSLPTIDEGVVRCLFLALIGSPGVLE